MKVAKLNTLTACERFKEILVKEGVTAPVFIGGFPMSNIPDTFISVIPNGGASDEGCIGDTTILLAIATKLVDFMPNLKKIKILTEQVSDILAKKLSDKTYEFRVHPRAAFDNGSSIENGYNMTFINLYCQIKNN